MKNIQLILLLLALFLITSRAEDSYTAVMNYLQSAKSPNKGISGIQEVIPEAVKSLLIHPAEREWILGKNSYSRPELPYSYISENGHFKIHYDTAGSDAVDSTATIISGVPDYVVGAARAAEYSWRILMDTLGFDPPPVDHVLTPATDLYIKNLAGLDYAYTYPENPVSSTPDRPEDYTAYMVIDNDYAESGYWTNGLNGMRVTVAHEFFHVVQLGYNWWKSNGLIESDYSDRYFLEWSSTWFEERAYPATDDYINYLDDFFYRPYYSVWHDSYAYTLGPFISYLIDIYDDEIFIQRVWENIKNQYALQALMSTIESYGGDLALRYNNYMRACYFTGSRYDERYAATPDAIDFPLLSVAAEDFIDGALIENRISPLATRIVAIAFSENQYLDMQIIAEDPGNFTSSYIIDKFAAPDFQRPIGNATEAFIGETGQADRLIIFITNRSLESEIQPSIKLTTTETFPSKILAIYSNPYAWRDQNPLNIDLQLGKFIDKISYTIYNIRGQRVYHLTSEASDLSPGIIRIEIASEVFRSAALSSGVYIFQIGIDGTRINRKFAIIN